MNKLKQNKAITLIALIITIIVLLILAGVVLNMTIGNDGIISKAQGAVDAYQNTAEQEQAMLNEVANYVVGNRSENSTVTMKTVKAGSGTVKVPIPDGFYYVGGDLDTGVIISDNKADENKATDWTLADDANGLKAHNAATSLVGNQFVWISCNINDYHKYTFTKEASDQTWGTSSQSGYYDTTTNTAEEVQIRKYGGFYVARYEAGTSDLQGIDFSEAYTCTTKWVKPGMNYNNITRGNVTSKANEIPYYHADYLTAVEMSKRMYANSNSVCSGLMTGTQWDIMITVMNTKTGCSLSNSNWGNYANVSLTDCRGKYAYMETTSGSSARGSNLEWTDNSAGNNAGTTISSKTYVKMLSTGSSPTVQKMHIYDVAGNLDEWTQEMGYNTNLTSSKMRFNSRGSSQSANSDEAPASFRNVREYDYTDTESGFRVVLYLK